MKTKGLNFLEAVKAMKEGKKVRRESWATHIYSHGDKTYWKSGFLALITLENVEATDWEIISSDEERVDEDSNWNLAKYYRYDTEFKIDDVKKCRDLIIKDLENSGYEICEMQLVKSIVNKRFGKL